MNQNVQQIASDRLALEIGRLTVTKILLEAQIEELTREKQTPATSKTTAPRTRA